MSLKGRVPDKIPDMCGKCTHYHPTGLFNEEKGQCSFYVIKTRWESSCHVFSLLKEGKVTEAEIAAVSSVAADLGAGSRSSAHSSPHEALGPSARPAPRKSARYKYHIVPFVGELRIGQGVEIVSRQLADMINHQSSEGWEFDSVNSVHIRVQPGCLAALFGAAASYITYDQVVFRQERQG